MADINELIQQAKRQHKDLFEHYTANNNFELRPDELFWEAGGDAATAVAEHFATDPVGLFQLVAATPDLWNYDPELFSVEITPLRLCTLALKEYLQDNLDEYEEEGED